MGSNRDKADPVVIRVADGSRAVYIDLERAGASGLPDVIAAARALAVDWIWASGYAVDPSFGFERVGGYARFDSPSPLMPIDLPSPPPTEIRDLQIASFEGIWGHTEPASVNASSSTFVGLHENGRWVGICEVDTARRRIVDPGVRRGLRTPERYARLVRGAAGRLGPGAVRLETRGDSDDTLTAYKQIGFSLTEYVPGWQLKLRNRRSPLPV